MAMPWDYLPDEIRTNIYRQYFSSVKIVLHRNLEGFPYDDLDSSSIPRRCLSVGGNDDVEQSADTELHARVEQTSCVTNEPEMLCNVQPNVELEVEVEAKPLQQEWLSILLTNKQIKEDTYDLFYSLAYFTIENTYGHCIELPKFAIDARIRHLTIEQGPYQWLL